MAFSLLHAPDLFALTKGGRMIYQLSGNARTQSAGVKAINQVAFTGCPDGTTVTLTWNGRSYTYTARTTPTLDTEFPAGNGSAAHVDSLVSFFASRYEIREDFTVTRSNVLSLQTLLLTAKLTGPAYNLIPYTGINPGFATGISTACLTGGVDTVIRPQYGVYAELWLEKADGSAFERIYENTIDADQSGQVSFEVGSILHSQFSLDWPNFLVAQPNGNPHSARRYYIAFGEAFGSPKQIGRIQQSDTLYALYGGADYVHRAGSGFSLVSFLSTAGASQDWAMRYGPTTRYVLADEPQFLTFLNTRADAQNIVLEVSLTYDNNAATVRTDVVAPTAWGLGTKLTMPAGPAQLGLAIQNADGAHLREYSVRLRKAGTTNYFSTSYRYILNYTYQPYARYFAYESSLGCVDTLCTFGKGSAELQRFFEQAEKVLPASYVLQDGQFVDYDVRLQQQVDVTTGFRDEVELRRWNDFYRSASRQRVKADGTALPISIVSKSIKQAKDGDTQFAHSFQYIYAFQDDFYTGEQTLDTGDTAPPPGFIPAGGQLVIAPTVTLFGHDNSVPDVARQLTPEVITAALTAESWGNHADAGYMTQQTASSLFPPRAFFDDAIQAAQQPGAGVQVLVVDSNQGKARIATQAEVQALAGSTVVTLMEVPDFTASDEVTDAFNYLNVYPNPGDNDNPNDVVTFQTIHDLSQVVRVITELLNSQVAQKVDKVTGKGLSTNDFTDLLKTKLESLSATSKGDKGDTGTPGTKWITLNQDPATVGGTLGNVDDLCLNKLTGDVFQRMNALPNNTPGTWQFVINLLGPRGPQGNPGSGGGGGSGVTYMPVPDGGTGDPSGYFETFPLPTPAQENDVVTWQTLSDVAHNIFPLIDGLTYHLGQKVDAVPGKGLSTHDLTDALYNKLLNLPTTGVKGDKGDPGQKGDTGLQGPVGPVGPAGNGQGSLTNFNFGGTTYYALILTLPASSAGTYDESILVVGLSFWDGSNKKSIRLQCSNRSGFRVSSLVQYGDANQASVVAYQDMAGNVALYIKAPLGFNVSSVTYVSLVQTTPVTELAYTTTEPDGTLVYDSASVLPDLGITSDGLTTRSLPLAAAPLNIMSRNIFTGKFEVSTIADMFAVLVQKASNDAIAALAARLAGSNNSDTSSVVTFGTHYEEVADTVAPTITGYLLGGPTSLGEGNTIHVYLTARYSDGSAVRNTSAVVWSIDGSTPSALTLTPTGGGAELDLTLGSINASSFVTLRATIGGGYVVGSINLIDSICTRPANIPLHVWLVYNYQTSDGNAHLFSNLDDANNTMGRVFNESNIGIIGFSKFKAELSNTNPGTDVYVNWQSEGDNSCAHVSDNNYYLLDGNANDSLKVAVRVENGLIVTQKGSTYAPPVAKKTTVYKQAVPETTNGQANVLTYIWVDGPDDYKYALYYNGAYVNGGNYSNVHKSPGLTYTDYTTVRDYISTHAIGPDFAIGVFKADGTTLLAFIPISNGIDSQPVLVYTNAN